MPSGSARLIVSGVARWLAAGMLGLALIPRSVTAHDTPRPRNLKPGPTKTAAAVCADEIAKGLVCPAANHYALELMRASNLEAATVVQDVNTGALLAFAASDPDRLDVTTPLLPLSVIKLMLAASWWSHGQPEELEIPNARAMSVHEMIVSGSDNAGRRVAALLRRTIGARQVLDDLGRYGFPSRVIVAEPAKEITFWAQLPTAWRTRLNPHAAFTSLTVDTPDQEWEDTLSIGEHRFTVTALHVSRFLQAVGNDGVLRPPVARKTWHKFPGGKTAVMDLQTAQKLQAAMRGVVERGTAKDIANLLADTGWRIGGKTGSGGGAPVGPQSDGWFAGLIFSPRGKAQFTVATFVRRGGRGGGNAARISAQLARFLIGVPG